MKKPLFFLLTLLVTFLHIQGEIHHVPYEFFHIQSAIDASSWGDTILVAPGIYNELLQIPVIELTLASNYILSQDTTYINETILDGEYQGTIIEVLPTGNDRIFCLNGFTVQHGLGWYGEQHGRYGAGAVQAFDSSNLVIENSVFTENIAPNLGAVLSLGNDGNHGSLLLRNLKVFNNNHHDTLTLHQYVIYAPVYGNFTIDGFHGIGVGDSKYAIQGGATDTMLVRNLIIENYDNTYGGNIIRLHTTDYMQLENLFLKNNSLPDYILELFSGVNVSTISIRNLWITDNSPSRGIRILTDTLYADSVFFLRNRGGNLGVCGGFLAHAFGQINHLVVQDNAGGVLGYNPYDAATIFSTNCSINDGLFANDTIYLHNDPDDPDDSVGGNGILEYTCQNPPNVLENCRFVDNFLDDPDDYSNPNLIGGGNQGRALRVQYSGSHSGVILRHCLFQNNRQPNIAPDKPLDGGGNNGVGSVVFFNDNYLSDNCSVHLEDVVIVDNDDGGIMIDEVANVEMRNVQIVNTPRRGIDIYSSKNVLLENILISGVIEQENYFSYPWSWCSHSALRLVIEDSAIVRNLTITDCNLPYLLVTGSSSMALPEFHNTLITGNSYQYLRQPNNGNPVYAEYSYIQEAVEGSNNIIGNDPLFHTELGFPYLDAVSPCIDAGNPDPAYNDPDDPEDPGTPLWPAQGTFRNDIGFTGGPWAMVQEFEGIANPTSGQATPQQIQLSQNYPNPFNPTTTIEFTLPYPQDVQLTVYNILGQQVQLLADRPYSAGVHQVRFDGSGLASGVYVYRLVAGDRAVARKMVLVE